MKKLTFITFLFFVAVTVSAQGTSRLVNWEVKNDPQMKKRVETALAAQKRQEYLEAQKTRAAAAVAVEDEVAFISNVDKSKQEDVKRIYKLTLENMDLLKKAYPKNSWDLRNIKILYTSLYERCANFKVSANEKPVYRRVGQQIGNGQGRNFQPKDKTERYAYAYFVNMHNDRLRLNAAINRLDNKTLSDSLKSLTNHPYWISSIDTWKDLDGMKLTETEEELQHSRRYKKDCLSISDSFRSWLCQMTN